jgi:hypothetical protein
VIQVFHPTISDIPATVGGSWGVEFSARIQARLDVDRSIGILRNKSGCAEWIF